MGRRVRRPLITLVCLGVIAVALLVNQSAVHWRENVADSHMFGYFGWCVAHGARPYLDVWDNKPPGIWWVNALAERLTGSAAGSDLLVGASALLVALLAFVGVATTVYHRSLGLPAAIVAAVVLTDVRFECGANRTETLVVACELLAVAGYVRWLRRRTLVWLVLGGLAVGAAPLFKQAGVAAAVACALHLGFVQCRARRSCGSVRWWKPWIAGGLAAATLPALAVGVIAAQGALGEAAFAVGTFNRAYFAVDDATWTHMSHAVRAYWPGLEQLGSVLLLAGAGAVWAAIVRIRAARPAGDARPHRGLGVICLWLVLASYLACVGPGRQEHHLMPTLPPLGLLALYPLHWLARRQGLRATLTARPASVVLVVVLGAVLASSALGSAGAAARCWRSKPRWYALENEETAKFARQAREIARYSLSTERIYVWGWSPGTYRFARRLPTSRYATFEKLGQVGVHARFIFRRALEDLHRDPPRVLAISPADHAGLGQAEDDREFGKLVRSRYWRVASIGGMHLLVRFDDAPPAGPP